MKIINLSSRELSADEIKLLLRGLKFVPKPKSPNLLDLEIDIKEFIRSLKLKEHFHNKRYKRKEGEAESVVTPKSDFMPTEVKNPVLEAICETLENAAENLENLVPQGVPSNLSKAEQIALDRLKRDEMIII